MIVEGISKRIATYLHENIEDKERNSFNKLYYGLQIIVNFSLVAIILFIISIALGVFLKTLLIFIMIALLRQVSGGWHLKSSELCALASIIIILIISEIPSIQWNVYVDIISLLIIMFYAPATFKVRRERRTKEFYIMKVLSVLIVLSDIVFLKNSQISIIFFLQSLSVVYEHYRLKKRDV